MVLAPPCSSFFPFARPCTAARRNSLRARAFGGFMPVRALIAAVLLLLAVPAGATAAPDVEIGMEDERLLRSEEHTSELQSRQYLVCRLLLEKKNKNIK